MAKNASLFTGMASGKVGDVIFSHANGTQQVRVYNRSNRNKGVKATEAQRRVRLRMPMLSTIFRMLSGYLRCAYGSRPDYQAFMKENVKRNKTYLTRDEIDAGAVVIGPFVLTKGNGKVNAVKVSYDATAGYSCSLRTGTAISDTTTVGQLSQGIVTANEGFEHGKDMLAFLLFDEGLTDMGIDTEVPTLEVKIIYFTIDTGSNELLSPALRQLLSGCTASGPMTFSGNHCAVAVTHTRKRSTTTFDVSDTLVNCDGSANYRRWSSQGSLTRAALSYGYSEMPELMPHDVDASDDGWLPIGGSGQQTLPQGGGSGSGSTGSGSTGGGSASGNGSGNTGGSQPSGDDDGME